MVSQDNWGDFKFEDTQPNSFLSLRNNIKEHICRLLPERKDLYQACLIHPQWRVAAQRVLWEKVQFEKPENLRTFLNTINSNNMAALLVKSVRLVFVDHDQDTPFPPIAKSKLQRHKPSTLSNLAIITSIASVCENITHIVIYGFRLGLQDIEQLSAYARNLKSLTVIGAPGRVPVNLNTLLPRLTALRLDGPFGLTPSWATSFAQKASNLTCLQFSLEGLQAATLDAICASGLNLTELTLTEAVPLNDAYVHQAFKSFPRLRRFRVESCVKLTSVSIAHGVLLCPDLLDLEIRAQAGSGANSSSNLNSLYDVLNSAHDSAVFARPTRLVLQNMHIMDEELHLLSRFFTQLKHVGISGCRALTNACFQKLVITEDFRFLQSLSIQNCPLIDSSLFGLMVTSQQICQSLMRVYFESCGEIDLHDIYQLCVDCYRDNLREVKLVHYEHLASTVLGTFNETESRRTLLLTRRSIDALAHSTDPVLNSSIPDNVTLTGKQLIRLADHLKMAVSDVVDLIAQVIKQEEQTVQLDYTDANTPRASHDRLMALRAPSRIDNRPSTPTVWSYDEAKNGIIVTPPKNRFEDSNNLIKQPTYQDEPSYHDEDDDEEKEEVQVDDEEDENDSFDHDDENETSYDDDRNEDDEELSSQSGSSWKDNSNNKVSTNLHPEGNLGGWGAPIHDNWATPSTPISLPTTKTSLKDVQAEQQQQQNQQYQQQQSFTHQNYWTSYKADAYENEWRQSPLEHNATHHKKNFTAGHYRNAPKVMESDGWGQAKDTIPWNDLTQQGFEKSVIEEQRNTDFWNQPAPGQWVIASGPSASKSNTAATPTTPSATSQHRRPPKNNQARNRSRKMDSSSSDEDQYDYTTGAAANAAVDAATSVGAGARTSFHGVVPSKARHRSNSVVSCDESINWDDDDKQVQIKVHPDLPSAQKPAASTAKSRDQQSTTHWSSATDWQAKSARIAATPTAHHAPTTPPATTPTTRFSRRATTPRNNSSSNTNSNTANNHNHNNNSSDKSWWDYAAKSADVPTFVPLRKVAPPPPSPQKSSPSSAATMAYPATAVASAPATAAAATPFLIDTDNGDSPKKPTRTGDIWSNLNELAVESYAQPSKTTPLKPSNSTTSPSVDDLFNMPDTSAMDNIKEFRFGERIAGTATDAELEREKAAIEKDNLVSFDSDSTPDEDQFEPKQDKGKPANLIEDSFASLDFNATTASILSPTPSKTPILSPLISDSNVSQHQKASSLAPSQPQQSQSTQVQPPQAQPSQVPPRTQQPQVQSGQQQLQLHSQQQPAEIIATKNATDRSPAASSPSTSRSPADILSNRQTIGHKPIILKFMEKPDLVITQSVNQDDDIPAKCRAYCEQHNLMNMLEIAINQAETHRTARITRRILRKSGKKNTSDSPHPQ
ncbi:hypothetical protein MAM1_0064d03922 [Mucor ambiguus]|uniref:Uncharacterized protein n=1 Tax=Mucor ambiguus TaxID=91626 RepID=A0A0C9MMQ9_9FUNG|nr:hypothetical protein MAM1_0064d03922 [Mucor ambiguus]